MKKTKSVYCKPNEISSKSRTAMSASRGNFMIKKQQPTCFDDERIENKSLGRVLGPRIESAFHRSQHRQRMLLKQ